MRRRLALSLLFAVVVSACGSGLGLGAPACEEVRSPTGAMILTAQAVPTARYGPCIDEMKLGWDAVDFGAEQGMAGFGISRGVSTFLNVVLTPACEPDTADEVPSGVDGVRRFEDVTSVESMVSITLVPSSDRSLIYAKSLIDDYSSDEINGRLVSFTIDDDMTQPIRARANRAALGGQIVVIVTDLDVEDRTVQLRTGPGTGVQSLELDDALEEIEESIPEVSYRGEWVLAFEGGCITYHFDAGGRVAEGLADDVEQALGLYDLAALREGAARLGFPIEAPPTN